MSKKALVTGGSGGIGASCAEALARDGFFVTVCYGKNREKAEAVAAKIGGQAIQADISDPGQVRRMMEQVGIQDVLVCCAGIAWQGLLTDMTDEQWRKLFAVNLDGAFYCCREAIPGMVHQKSGSIITVSSMWGETGASCEVAYSASKAALIGFTKALAKELGPSHIRVNCVSPGVIDTDMNRVHSPETMAQLAADTPLERIGTPQDVAETVAFLASDRADFLTGQVIGVNGGYVI